MDGFDDDDDFVSPDFQTIIGMAQYNELVAEEKRRSEEREKTQELMRQQHPQFRTLPQIMGLRSQAELDKELNAKMDREEAKSNEIIAKEKEEANARLESRFPPPNITDK